MAIYRKDDSVSMAYNNKIFIKERKVKWERQKDF